METTPPARPAAEREHLIQVRLLARSAGTLMEIVRRLRVDFNCGGPVPTTDGRFALHVYVPASRLDTLKLEGIDAEVVGDATAEGQARMREVAAGNRFADRKHVPRGLGTKIRSAKA